ncbi:cobW-domain-containing protein [Zopfochytrium polystomum]|nr:cobW-domain-containing protein [Zopfochytrium polystomum]
MANLSSPTPLRNPAIPVTVLTGFLGSGKTTIILSMLQRLPRGYKAVVLKNEFGDVKIDSELVAAQSRSNEDGGSALAGVAEMLNGCLCCVLVGQMKTALLEIRDKYQPDRIIIETSGSAFPAPIAWQIRQMADDGFTLDGIVTVVDCMNFTGYEDTSYTAKMQAKYTDVILLNKHELVSERQLDLVLDHVYELNEDTPKLKCEGTRGVSPDVVFGIDTKLFQLSDGKTALGAAPSSDAERAHHDEVEVFEVLYPREQPGHVHSTFLESLSPASPGSSAPSTGPIYRVKGVIRTLDAGLGIINWAFGRHTWTPLGDDDEIRKNHQDNDECLGL